MSETPEDDQETPDEVETEYEAAAAEHQIAPVSFNILVLSLNTSALVHLGDAPGYGGAEDVDLALARQTIDMLAMLEDKTRGNLSGEEERLLSGVLFDLRMRFTRKATG